MPNMENLVHLVAELPDKPEGEAWLTSQDMQYAQSHLPLHRKGAELTLMWLAMKRNRFFSYLAQLCFSFRLLLKVAKSCDWGEYHDNAFSQIFAGNMKVAK